MRARFQVPSSSRRPKKYSFRLSAYCVCMRQTSNALHRYLFNFEYVCSPPAPLLHDLENRRRCQFHVLCILQIRLVRRGTTIGKETCSKHFSSTRSDLYFLGAKPRSTSGPRRPGTRSGWVQPQLAAAAAARSRALATPITRGRSGPCPTRFGLRRRSTTYRSTN